MAREPASCLLAWASAVALAVAGAPANAATLERWMLLSRESGCVSLQLLVKMERLSQAPSSPEAFAAMMRERGHSVSMSLPEGFPNEMAGEAVMVRYAENRAPIFLRSGRCPSLKTP